MAYTLNGLGIITAIYYSGDMEESNRRAGLPSKELCQYCTSSGSGPSYRSYSLLSPTFRLSLPFVELHQWATAGR